MFLFLSFLLLTMYTLHWHKMVTYKSYMFILLFTGAPIEPHLVPSSFRSPRDGITAHLGCGEKQLSSEEREHNE